MKQVRYAKRNSMKDGRKRMSIWETSDEKECKTSVKKHFIYIVQSTGRTQKNLNPPRIDISKNVDTKRKEEKFHFRVKGSFYLAQNEQMFEVNFCHSLDITITWNKSISPKKSANLT